MKGFVDLLQQIFLAGKGRPVALAILLWLSLLSLMSERGEEARRDPTAKSERSHLEAAIETLAAPMTLGRQALFDNYQRMAPRVRETQPVAIVEIDEYSLKELGQWPWPRNRLAELIKAINAYEPAVIGLDMYMPEPDATSPQQVAKNLPKNQTALAVQLAKLPNHDQILAVELFSAPTVLGAAGFDFETYTSSTGLRTVPIEASGGNPLEYVRQFPFVLASLPELQEAAQGQAVLSVSIEDAVVRRLPMVLAVGDQMVPSLAMEMFRVATAEKAIRVRTGSRGVEEVAVADLAVPTQKRGDVYLHFAQRDSTSSRQVSAAEVLAGNIDIDMLRGKLVLIGLTGMGLSDSRATPLGQLVPGIEIQAQMIESLFEKRFLLRPWWMKGIELGLLLGIGLLMIHYVPRSRNRFSKMITTIPRATTWLVMALNILFVIVGHTVFRKTGLLFDAAALFVGFSSVLASLVSSLLIEISKDNEQLAQDKQRLREEGARVAGELAAARLIQLASLPLAGKVFAGEPRFAVAALLEPAREVGGDLYDFFMLDERHMFFVIGDVSGKGVPASLFMAVTKALAKSAARRGNGELALIVETANREISGENPESLFVTAVAGIYDADSGHLTLCNAGHDAPLCRRADGRLEPLAAASGPPLCVLDDFPYGVEEFTLQPGDSVLLYTDGLTEAQDGAQTLYGATRLHQALEKLAVDSSAENLVTALRDQLREFVGIAEAADDLTLLVLRRNPPPTA